MRRTSHDKESVDATVDTKQDVCRKVVSNHEGSLRVEVVPAVSLLEIHCKLTLQELRPSCGCWACQ
jgi:hypothetical protein